MDQVTSRTDSIGFRGVSLTRGGTEVLRGLDLTLRERRIGIVGRNGAGKSSLTGLLNGLLTPTAGSVSVMGRDAAANRADLPGVVGMVFQNPDHQIVFPTVIEEIAFSFEMTGVPRKDARTHAAAYLAKHDLSAWAERPVHSLSEGQKHWLCILAVLATAPKVLVLDEPFASLDLANRIGLSARLRTLTQMVILISHDLDALADFERILWLDAGAIRMDGPPAEVLAAYRADAERRAADPAC